MLWIPPASFPAGDWLFFTRRDPVLYIRTTCSLERCVLSSTQTARPSPPARERISRISTGRSEKRGHLEMRRATPPRRRVGPPFRHELLRLQHRDDD